MGDFGLDTLAGVVCRFFVTWLLWREEHLAQKLEGKDDSRADLLGGVEDLIPVVAYDVHDVHDLSRDCRARPFICHTLALPQMSDTHKSGSV